MIKLLYLNFFTSIPNACWGFRKRKNCHVCIHKLHHLDKLSFPISKKLPSINLTSVRHASGPFILFYRSFSLPVYIRITSISFTFVCIRARFPCEMISTDFATPSTWDYISDVSAVSACTSRMLKPRQSG